MQGATQVALTGGTFPVGFNLMTVTFGGTPATSVECDTSTSCVVYTPAANPGLVDVTVTINGVPQTAPGAFTFVGPSINSVLPASGPITGGTVLQVSGVNMTDTSQSTFTAPATIGGISAGTAFCDREGLYDAVCTLTTPPVSSPGPLDVQITITHTTGAHIPTTNNLFDRFTYTASPALSTLFFAGSEVGGATATGTVYLNGNAPAAGATVSLALSAGAPTGVITLPLTGNVVINAGTTSATFPVTIIDGTFTGSVGVDATYAGTTVTGTLNVTPAPPPTLAPIGQICSAQIYNETVTLPEAAPPNGATLSLASDNAVAVVSGTVMVPANALTVTFPVTIGSTTTTQTPHLTATYFGAATTLAFTVVPAAALTMSLPSSVASGHAVSGTVSLCAPAPAPSGAVVSLQSTLSIATPSPMTVTIPAGGTSGPITVDAGSTLTNKFTTIVATYQGATASSPLEVTAAPPKCPAGEQLCTCSNGTHACLSNANQCLTFCR